MFIIKPLMISLKLFLYLINANKIRIYLKTSTNRFHRLNWICQWRKITQFYYFNLFIYFLNQFWLSGKKNPVILTCLLFKINRYVNQIWIKIVVFRVKICSYFIFWFSILNKNLYALHSKKFTKSKKVILKFFKYQFT